MVVDASGMRRLGPIPVSAAYLWQRGVEMCLADGGGIGWVLVGSLGVGDDRVTFECPADDPDFAACIVNASAGSGVTLADVLVHIGLPPEHDSVPQG